MDEYHLKKLLNQYFNNSISRDDCEELLKYLDENTSEKTSRLINDYFQELKYNIPFEGNQKEDVYNRVINDIQNHRSELLEEPKFFSAVRFQVWCRIAAILIAIFFITFLLYKHQDFVFSKEKISAELKDDILLPNSNSALLTLSDGRTIKLNDSLDDVSSRMDGIKVGKSLDGSVYYEIQPNQLANKSDFNTFSTSKGHTIQLLLPDGTMVWLNTESIIRFPASFASSKRVVELVGEAYFEVAHNPSKPFEVETNNSLIHVLGTHFNVTAYLDIDEVLTTLVEGAVNVSKNGTSVVLKPGEQASVDSKTGEISKSKVDVRKIMAWKKGYFRFDNVPIESIVNDISRWYDIKEVIYEGTSSDRFTGTFQRSKALSQLLGHLEKISTMQFKIEGRRMVIMK